MFDLEGLQLIMKMNRGAEYLSILLKGTEIVGMDWWCVIHDTKNLTFTDV